MNIWCGLWLGTFCWALAQETTGREEVTVYGVDAFRRRLTQPAPLLVYDRAFFDRFGPDSVGDILARLPGIAGTADAGEFDQPQLRGIAPKFSRILINGEPVPGEASDRALVLDRIPAHLVARVEVARSADASAGPEGIAGTINIVLREPATRSGWSAEVGMLSAGGDSDHPRATLTWDHAAAWGGITMTAGVFERHNPKRQQARLLLFEEATDDGDPDDPDPGGEVDKRFRRAGEEQFKAERNTLDARDTALTTSLQRSFAGGAVLRTRLTYLRADVTEREDAVLTDAAGDETGAFDHDRGRRENHGLGADLTVPLTRVQLHLSASYHRFRIDRGADIGQMEDGAVLVEEQETDHTRDEVARLAGDLHGPRGWEAGFALQTRRRDARFSLLELNEETDQLTDSGYGGVFRVDEDVWAAWLSRRITRGRHGLLLGLRAEQARMRFHQPGRTRRDTDLFPSLHYVWETAPGRRLRAGYAETVTRPDFGELQPFRRRNTPYDGLTLVGNPALRPEYASGLDLGYEWDLAGREGLLGLNLVVRRVRDRVETTAAGEGLFQPANVGDGTVYGLELDLGTPLSFMGLPGVGAYLGAGLQDSSLHDAVTGERRRFNLQPAWTANASLVHTLPLRAFSYGLHVLDQGPAEERLPAEWARIDVGMRLDAFAAWTARGWSVRLTGRNLADGGSRIAYREFAGAAFQAPLLLEGRERERAGRSFHLSVRTIF